MESTVPNDTQQWIVLAAIVQIICSTLVAIVSLIVQKKVEDTKKEVEQNTKITEEVSAKADSAAKHAKTAHAVGVETLKAARETRAKADETAEKVQEIQEGSGLIKRKDHIEGDKP